MDEKLLALGRRAQAACPPLLDCPGVRVFIRLKDHPCEPAEAARWSSCIVTNGLRSILHDVGFLGMSLEEHDPILDVRHPGSRGWMLEKVRELHDRPWARVTAIGGEWEGALNEDPLPHSEDLEYWQIWYPDPEDGSPFMVAARGQTEEESLVIALEAAGGRVDAF